MIKRHEWTEKQLEILQRMSEHLCAKDAGHIGEHACDSHCCRWRDRVVPLCRSKRPGHGDRCRSPMGHFGECSNGIYAWTNPGSAGLADGAFTNAAASNDGPGFQRMSMEEMAKRVMGEYGITAVTINGGPFNGFMQPSDIYGPPARKDIAVGLAPCPHCDELQRKLTEATERLHRPCASLASTERKIIDNTHRFLCDLWLGDQSREVQREHVEIVRALGKLLGDDK